jgi:lipoprotein signal peptidase
VSAHVAALGEAQLTTAARLRMRLFVMLLGAAAFAALDQWVKLILVTPDWAYHQRSATWFVSSLALFLAMAGLALLPSLAVAVGAALFAGGLLGNLISAGANHLEVANPLLLGYHYGIAFNVADVCILTGNLTLMVACSVLAIRNRARLEAWQAGAIARIMRR